MKVINGIISVFIGGLGMYFFITATVGTDMLYGFICLLAAMLFLCFTMLEEQKQKIEKQRQDIQRLIIQKHLVS